MSSPSASLNADLAAAFARIALGHVTREYPHKLDHVLDGDADAQPPRVLHPIFHGSFDFHSCVHGYWTLATVLRLYPDTPQAAQIRALFDASFTAQNIEIERAYALRPSSRGFVRPYGWAWVLMLAAELERYDAPWGRTFRPLAQAFAGKFKDFLPKATYPVRVGTHFNTAFAVAMALPYADAHDAELAVLARDTARRWYSADQACQAWEPSGDDFLSSALTEALCMKSVLPASDFAAWFAAFLPDIGQGAPATLFTPAVVSDRTDGKIAHLDGLNLSRAWCWRSVGRVLPEGAARTAALAAADTHLASALHQVEGDYMGEHWLATYALLALMA